jgi:hypothetical protein
MHMASHIPPAPVFAQYGGQHSALLEHAEPSGRQPPSGGPPSMQQV